ncbi:unnamed protein product, partial [Cyprideis torosa]
EYLVPPALNPKPEEAQETVKKEVRSSPLIFVVEFLRSLATLDEALLEKSKVIVSRNINLSKACFRCLLLDPTPLFEEVVRDARSVILAGGTMQPIEEFKDHLFDRCLRKCSPEEYDRVQIFSCGHVVPPTQLFACILTKGPTGREFQFTFANRQDMNMLNELGAVLKNMSVMVPGGIVVFLASYDMENRVFTHLEKSGALKLIETKKKVFREPKDASNVEKILTEFDRRVRLTTGAMLFCVMGGKMSEGINFSDDLGRCVIVVGLPYPNKQSVELQEKMKYLDHSDLPGSLKGSQLYHNLCMKAVNQSIGRAIRHRDDYAQILLLDSRIRVLQFFEGCVLVKTSWKLRSSASSKTFDVLCIEVTETLNNSDPNFTNSEDSIPKVSKGLGFLAWLD